MNGEVVFLLKLSILVKLIKCLVVLFEELKGRLLIQTHIIYMRVKLYLISIKSSFQDKLYLLFT